MSDSNNPYRQLSQRIVLNLARQQELRQKIAELENTVKDFEVRTNHLMREVKLLNEENSDLKEIIYELHQENKQMRKVLGDAAKDESTAPGSDE